VLSRTLMTELQSNEDQVGDSLLAPTGHQPQTMPLCQLALGMPPNG
jgi:hypothetical protein